MGACSREEPQPKLRPATMMSPGVTRFTQSGSRPAMQFSPSFLGSVVTRKRAGMMASVSICSPTLWALPLNFMICPPAYSWSGPATQPATALAAATTGLAR